MKTYVLVPGAWHGAWSWVPVADRLRAAGARAVTTTLPGLADGDDPSDRPLLEAVDHIVRLVEEADLTDVVLVGHSWGGYPVTGAAQKLAGRLSGIVYYAAQVPVAGRSLLEDNPPEAAAFLRSLIQASPTGSIAPALEYVQQIFLQDAAPELQRLVADLLTPQPGRYSRIPQWISMPEASGSRCAIFRVRRTTRCPTRARSSPGGSTRSRSWSPAPTRA